MYGRADVGFGLAFGRTLTDAARDRRAFDNERAVLVPDHRDCESHWGTGHILLGLPGPWGVCALALVVQVERMGSCTQVCRATSTRHLT